MQMSHINNDWITEINELLSTQRKIVLTMHFNPDGDSLGSSLALQQFLHDKGHVVNVIAPNAPAAHYLWLPGARDMTLYSEEKEKATTLLLNAEIIFTLDFNELSRVGEMQDALKAAEATLIMIDHHPNPEPYTKYLFSEPSVSSASELCYEFMCAISKETLFKKSIAECIFTGIMTDTGLFQHNSNNPSTFRTVANLLECGINKDEIKYKTFDTNSEDRLRLMGFCLSERMTILPEYNMGYIYLTLDDLKRFNFKKGDHEGFVNYPLSVNGVRFSALIIEQKDLVKVSTRSKGEFDVNLLMRKHFNGGGHRNASGGRTFTSLHETILKLKSILPEYKAELTK